MAIDSKSVWEARSGATASNAGGGFWVPGSSGSDWSQQNAPQYTLTNCGVTSASAVITTASAAADMVGNGGHLVSGTNATVGWYQVLSVVVGVSITVDRACATGTGSNIAFNVGGAVSLGASTDQALFNTMVAGNKMWVKNGTYTLTGTLNVNVAVGTATQYIIMEGYNTARGDQPKGSTRPVFTAATHIWDADFAWLCIEFKGNVAGDYFQTGGRGFAAYCKFSNSTTTANQSAVLAANYCCFLNCEFISPRGPGLKGANALQVCNSYFHDSDIGIQNSNAAANYTHVYANNIIESCVTAAISHTGANDTTCLIYGNTLYGSENKTGSGIKTVTNGAGNRIVNNIIYGFAKGIDCADSNQALQGSSMFIDFNTYFNNTADVSNVTKGPNDIATNPSFTSVAQLTGTAGVVSGSTLVVSSATGIVANRDFVYILSGTGATAGQYLITNVVGTTLTLNSAPGGSGSNIVYQITTGRNFAVGSGLKGTGSLGVFPAAITTGYQDIGAVQRQEPAAGGSFTFGGG